MAAGPPAASALSESDRLRPPAGLKHRIFARNIEALTCLRELKASCLLLGQGKLPDGAPQHAQHMQELRLTAAADFEGETHVHIFHGFPITVCKLPTLTSLQLTSAGEHMAHTAVLLHLLSQDVPVVVAA